MTDLERRVRESIVSAAEGSAPEPPDAADLLAQAHDARTARRRTAMAGIAAVVILMLSLVVVLADREDRGGGPATSPSPSPSTKPIPAGWKVVEDSGGLRMSVPPGTLVNPTACPYDGRSYVLTVGRRCGGPTSTRTWKQAPVVIWFLGGDGHVKPPAAQAILQTLNRDGLSGFVQPMLDPGFIPTTKGATYTWTVAENTTTTTIYLFGTDPVTAQQVIDSLRLADR